MENWNYNWIGGARAVSQATIEVLNPATGECIGHIPDLAEDQVLGAIDAAVTAQPGWAAQTARARAGYLEDWAARLLSDRERLARLLSVEQGKPLAEALGEIEGTADIIRWYAEEAKRAYGEIIPASNPGQQLLVYKEPIGVVALITPMNFPAATVARKVAPALAAGCTLVLKPAETTAMVAIAVFEHLHQTGLPGGVANLVTGDPARLGRLLMADPRIRKVSFTGSTAVGKKLMEQAAATVKKVSLELGGNSPVIVFQDADLEQAAQLIVGNKFENCGQVCNGINLIYVHREVYDELADRLRVRIQELRTGAGLEPGVDVGPLINERALRKVERLVGEALSSGAVALAGGARLTDGEYARGIFYAPTLLGGVTREMDIAHEEIFGPVAPLIVFDSEEEVVAAANDTRYGLAAYVFTQNFARIHRLIRELHSGNIGVNGTSLAYTQAPFGGVKESGVGREGGRQGLEEFMAIKYVALTTG
ncbi:NAD-dependent succinate-semialdehyde dehydrogenase [Paenibacillus sp. SYP-B4298]|uniref:NAD-dependent succinate-semialdehyde dehydrogenase n=1 Tax=Paenibacillus sp. SYP-B4298 TaxID=2996034 RepID=UPI0022DE2BF7|nr:NAD-dependent succinate-semialdehyde dehydrogenase [Paenibacillus sp. SYP-B4298]